MAIDINIATTFLGNTDTPSTYVGQGSKVVSVKVDETGLEFTTVSGGGGNNIYNTDGTLTGNRVVSYNGFNLTFGVANSGGTLKTVSPGASASDTAFAVRNSLDNANLLSVQGNSDIAIGNIGNTGARLGVKSGDNSASTYNTLLTNLAGDFLFQLDNDGGLRTNIGNYRQFKFGNDNYFETVGGSAYYRGNGFGYFNVNLSGGINFESTNFGGGQAHVSAKVQIESTTQGFRIVPMTATQASAITPTEGLELNVSNTNGTFTSIGKWQYIGGAWVKL